MASADGAAAAGAAAGPRRGRRGLGHRRGRSLGGRSRSGLGGGRRGGGGGAGAVVDDRQLGAHLDGLVLADLDRGQDAGGRRRDLGVDLVGGDLEQGLVHLHALTLGLQPAGDGAFGHALAQRGQCY
ncbi:ABC transporter ATPase [Kitasatospora cheerisanensis KCTC 2395]|uniref:ABC transporter ATPase n=1 Tax=Kitasatospora cheerisanensis KCTC 2395 TaxID=1348663 RepID=A0A066YYV2_9ACTN|nr:ABC transporter ATPase [Kitasatospora cheerisanensis KCTC 2395]